MQHWLVDRTASRKVRTALAIVAAALVAALGAGVPAAAAGTAHSEPARAAAAKTTTHYAIGKRACKPPKKPGLAACFAEIRIRVKEGTKGAHKFKIGAGATAAGTIGPAGGLTPATWPPRTG